MVQGSPYFSILKMIVNSFPSSTIIVDDEEYLYFGGTSYLGMATHPEFQQILIESIKKWGTYYGSSRNSNIKLSVYDKAEQLFSNQIGAEKSVIVSSGTLAGKLTTEYLSRTIATFFHYPKTHPAILANHSIPLFVDGNLHPRLKDTVDEEIVITADAILALEVTPTSFDFLDEISLTKKITLVLDESHSIGVVGKNGEGVFNSILNKRIDRKIFISSLGKALSLSGGIIASNSNFINKLKEEPLFVSSSAANPAYLETYLQAQHIYTNQRKKLHSNITLLSRGLNKTKNLIFTDNYPVIYSNNDTIFARLLENKMVITNFKYPTYKNKMSRIVITANHTEKQLEQLRIILTKEVD